MELFRALIGSQNYGLATETSDEDFYVYHCPTFEEIYNNKSLVREEKTDNGILFHKDIRSLPNMIKKSSFNQLEILWSTQQDICDISTFKPNQAFVFGELMGWLHKHRDEIARANLPRLFQSTMGELRHRFSDIGNDKYTSGTKDLFKKYGYDTKNAMHGIRLCYMLEQLMYPLPLGQIFEDTPIYTYDNITLLEIKAGAVTKDYILEVLNEKINKFHLQFTDWFNYPPINTELLEGLEHRVFNLVREFAKD